MRYERKFQSARIQGHAGRATPSGTIIAPTRELRSITVQQLTPKQAYEFLQANPEAIFVDVRSEMEHMFVGSPKESMLIPWVDGPEWDINPHFVAHVKKAASQNRPVVLICRSGRRSMDAGQALEQAGFTDVYNVTHGFEGDLDDSHHRNSHNGWRFDGLPWGQT
jgi:rhodanese-related sulfurtransferase